MLAYLYGTRCQNEIISVLTARAGLSGTANVASASVLEQIRTLTLPSRFAGFAKGMDSVRVVMELD
jgi:hypothetical protein